MRKKSVITACILLISLVAASAYPQVRPPVVAGQFYPEDSIKLDELIRDHLDGVDRLPQINGRIFAIIVPHAGLQYSGQIAAHAYKLLEGREIDNVILCGPSHRYRFRGMSVFGPGVSWQTPFGVISCNDDICKQLIRKSKGIRVVPEAHAEEHSLEVQLPYLQMVLDEFSIVPITMGTQDKTGVKLMAKALESLDFDEHTVMVASSDWQHYHSAKEGWPMDSLGMECIRKLEPDRLQDYLGNGQVEMCGGGAAAAVIKAAMEMGADRAKILKYGDSGDITGNKSSVVGYVAAVVYKSADPEPSDDKPRGQTEMGQKDVNEKAYLSDDEKQQLLALARQTITSYLKDGSTPQFDARGVLAEPGAAFVTLEKQGRLRGCIGHTVAVTPLWETVSTCAVSAAVQDPRFPPVKADEVDQLHIEISVLTPLVETKDIEDIVVGRDGLMIARGPYRGLLLPQVATDYGWDRETFLQHTCQKAGLPTDAYKSPEATIYKFQALVFGEE